MARGNRPLLGGVGNAPAGRGGIPDQLFAAREGIPIRDQIARAVAGMTEDEALPEPPTPNNRGVETFDTVRESLASSLGVNYRDNARRKDLQSAVDSMLQLIDEGDPARIAPEEVERYAQVVRAYQDAYNLQSPEQKTNIARLVPEPRRAEFEQFFGGPFAQSALEQTAVQQSVPGTREVLSQAMDRVGDEEQYLEDIGAFHRQPGLHRPYERTDQGRTMDRILGSLLDEYGIPPETIQSAMIGDAAIAPFNPGPGVNLSRDMAPARERLSSYVGDGVANSTRMRFGNGLPDKGGIGRELLNQTDAAAEAGVSPGIVYTDGGPIDDPQPGMVFTSADLNRTDPIVADQMRSQRQKVLDEIHNRVFGFTSLSENIMDGSARNIDDLKQVENPIDLDYMAPWIDGTTQQAIDGRVVRAGFLADQIVDTMLSQTKYAAEAPQIRAIAKERMTPLVERAIQLRREQGIEPTKQYNRNAAGRRLLIEDGAVEAPPPASKPASTGGMSIQEIKESLKRAAGAKANDMGFSEPMRMPRYMASAMPNRMLAGLLG